MYLIILNFKTMKRLHIYITIVFISIFTSCVEDITPNFEFEEQVFISGLLTSAPGFVSVQIQKTVPTTDDTSLGVVNDAQISLFTRDTANTISLISDSFIVNNGVYETTEVIVPIIGNTYWVEVVLKDQTILKSEEEILKNPIPIISMEKNEDLVKVTFTDQTEAQNYFLIRIEQDRDAVLVSDDWFVFNDTVVTNNLENFINIGAVNEGDSLRVSIYNINFNTFQFYFNVLNEEDDTALSTLFLPINIVGNITNITTNKQALGNFGIAGFSTMTMGF